ncbi:protein involved in biosynthesis of mitomycin antibiotics/polyketide fumonisin [Cylindrospermum stagnale PCC 7417]|uniref:Protein involved in biosynthesis of mitomycin antibiotics/polyketide fumonisin n=1 Tax=Cylindrospermum stagnale PCC 7417 TaxID=56107 RepID=K9X0Z4_9NOST|nr:phytanoyl-CoA dioxygenase family protein [Cylindrospermum stagnale]AFZ26285.1 protein involved in biosynthesis of mitomycin antibiotics/polyketide fumonisin [Cylindrospermum stagnale PCC 7417]
MVNLYTPRLNQEQIALLPTDKDVTFYEEHGWYISKKVIPDEMIDAAILASEKFYRGERDVKLPYSTGYSNWKPGDGDAIRNNEFVSLQNNVLRQFALQPIIGAIAARLTRSKSIRLFEDQLVYKAPHGEDGKGVVGWHTDHAYCSTCTSNKLLAAWIPFHDCDKSRAPLVVIDGSHKWSGNEHLRCFNQQNLKEIEQKFSQIGQRIVEVPMTLKKGQISFHHCKTIHGSYHNYSDSFRLAIAVHLQDDDNCYQVFWNPQGKRIHHFLDSICHKLPNGDPDYSDLEIFPVLWSAEDR